MSRKTEEYRLLFDIVLHESKAVWDTGQLFLIANTFLAAILGTNFPDFSNNPSLIKDSVFFFLAILGLIISVLWFFSFERTKRYYRFRMAKAGKFEKDNNLEPIFSGDAYDIANGGIKPVGDKDYDLKIFGCNLSSLTVVGWIIKLFAFFYLFLIIVYIFSFLGQNHANKFHAYKSGYSVYEKQRQR